jgi:hypothetical protein
MTKEDLAPLRKGIVQVAISKRFGWNSWVNYNGGEVYLRVSRRSIQGRQEICVDVANVTFPDDLRRQGRFKGLIRDIRRITDLPIYVENVLNPHIRPWLLRAGFEKVFGDDASPSYILRGHLTD